MLPRFVVPCHILFTYKVQVDIISVNITPFPANSHHTQLTANSYTHCQLTAHQILSKFPSHLSLFLLHTTTSPDNVLTLMQQTNLLSADTDNKHPLLYYSLQFASYFPLHSLSKFSSFLLLLYHL